MTNTDYPSATSSGQTARQMKNKNILIMVLAAGLLATWGYVLYDKNQSGGKIQTLQNQNISYLSQRDSLKMLYDEAESRLATLTEEHSLQQSQLSERQKEIAGLKSEIKSIIYKRNASEAELKRAKELIATLNDRISSMEAEIARLSNENQQLTFANTRLTEEKEGLQQTLLVSQTRNEELTKTVDVASTFSASNIQVTPVNEKKSGKEVTTSTAKKVDKLVISFDVLNRIAQSGPADLYIMVTGPDGKVINDETLNSGVLQTRLDGERTYTVKLPIQYEQGTTKNVQFPIPHSGFATGEYKVEIYHNGFKIGEATRTLKKGGLFG
jgi:predicted  nucleic acid-binding Zn-ribbon protein